MTFYHHKTISKITMALLDTFNDIEIERVSSDGLSTTHHTVPITFGARDKAFILSEQDSEAMLRGNVNILPRMALTFESMTPNKQRQTNKYTKINKVIDGERISFQYNAVAVDFSFTISIATRTMMDMSMIQEQIIPFFNPSYSLFVNELEIQDEPTSIPIMLESADIVLPEEYGEDEIRLIEGSLSILVKGNMYPPIKDAEKVEKVKIYMGMKPNDEELRSAKYEFDVDELLNKTSHKKEEFFETMGQNNPIIDNISSEDEDGNTEPIISHISGNVSLNDGKSAVLKVHFKDRDSDIFTYVWSVYNDIGTIETNKDKVKYVTPGNLTEDSSAHIRVIVIDNKGLQSKPYDFSIEIGV